MKPHRLMPLFASISLVLALISAESTRAVAAAPPTGSECGTENLIAGKAPWQQTGVEGNAALVTDGAVAPDGAIWDVPVAAKLNAGGALTYDLGHARSIAAIHIQADANDTYKITGSLDGAPGSYKFLAEIANVVDRGPGLRSRSLEIMPVSVRYLRVGEAEGDGFYSISEVAVYCRAPTPFPPVMRAVAAPLAQTGPAAPELPGKVERPRDNLGGRFELLVLGGLLVLLGVGGLLARKRTRVADAAAASPSAASPSDGSEPAAGVDLPQTADSVAAPRSRWSTHDLLRLLFAASGCAALIYEVVWFHLLRLVIGASALSVGIVLASFMGGMFLGSLLFARFVPPERNALRVYAVLEIGIGVFGLLMPLALPAVKFIYVGLVGYGPMGIVLRGLIAAVLLLPPTALMGATLPVIARRYTHGRRGMSGLASLYAANTVGAVLGCLVSGFYLLATWDVWVATATAAALNFVVGWYALRLGRDDTAVVALSAPPPAISPGGLSLRARAVLLAVGFSGLTALGAQVVWTRLLTVLFGATVYAFSIILAVFLAGLGLGSAIAAYLLRRGQNASNGLAWTQVALVPAMLVSAYLLADVLPYGSPPATTPLSALHGLHVLRAIAVILPGATLWGMSFPFALAAAAPIGGDAGRSSGRVYAANTLGAIVGALSVSFWAVPTFGTRWAQQSLVLAAGLSGTALLYALGRDRPAGATAASVGGLTLGRRPVWLPPAWALALGVLAAAFLPGPSTVFLAHGRYIWWVDARDQYPYVSEGAASTVAVHIGPDGYRNFHVSGRVEATNNPNDLRTERMLGHLSALAHPNPEAVLVVGLGAGITAGALAQHPEVKRIVICEIEPRVVGAANQFAHENYSALKDPKVQVIFDDARHFLATTREKFDIITSDPIHPWVRGNSVLFSREYYAVVRSKLKPGGIATQWVPLYETSEEAIQIQMKTFMDAFPEGTVWNTASNSKGYDVVLLGATNPLRLDLMEMQNRIGRTPKIAASMSEVKMASAMDLLSTYSASARDMKSWYAKTPLNRDFSLKLEYISGLALNAREADSIYAHMVAARTYPADVIIAPPGMETELRRRILGNATKALH